ncbi:phospholipid-transporting ATPase ABCA1 [Microplitis demolitor]|uniref:phospholipid-transporting ATPase ABCA1 n=1 Tax=Microplitis demolitor TaxID=69319 RepID=UPI0004CCF0EA|nr:phospholipid-transporting ATPase ABCA1 [Microplitis demolitor]
MGEKSKIFLLLLKKNFLVRKKHWAQSVIAQIVIPIVLFLIGENIQLMIDSTPTRVSHNTYYEIRTQSQLLSDVSMSGTYIKYTPQNNFTDKLMKSTRECLKLKATDVIGSKDEDTLIAELQRDFSTSEYPPECVGIIFESSGNSTLLKYKLRVSSLMPSELFDSEENSIQANFQFLKVPLVQVQMCLDQSYINLTVPEPKFHIPEITIQQMPYPPYIKVDKDAVITGDTFAELARLVFLIILCVEISFPANEKFIGINILMSVNGLKTRMNLLSWLVSGAIYSTTYLLPIVLLLKHFMPPKVRPFLLYGDAFIVWIALFIHACHVITFGYHISSYFWKPSHGIFVTFMVTTLMNILAIFVRGYTVERIFLYAGIFSPNFILKKIFAELTDYESKLTGIHWSNLFTTGSNTGAPEGSIGVLMIFSILGIIFHFFMTIYVYNVLPGKYGIRRSPFYFFQQRKSNKVDINENEIIFENIHANKKEFEVVPEGSLEPGIRIRRLKKIYTTDWFRNTKVYALKGVSLDFYKSQITALLGHNGAGKTTMMSILSGLTDLTEGVIFIDGKNILTNPDVISSNIGLCPQENMVFPDLNIHQQLMFFGTLKGKTKTKLQLEQEIDSLLSKVNLSEKKYAFPNQLSGGQKRRLCLAMAVVGDASVLILDEPTSGMDAESKREVWDIILKMRGEKTIIISTHDMEEADILGDRISIMHSGKTKCYGTSMFLKKLYGNGNVEITLSTEDWFDVTNISHEIGVTVQVVNQNDGKTVLIIPHIDNLPQALDKLELSKKQLGITGISVSMITLEQVFLQVTRENNDLVDSSDPIRSFDKNKGFAYYAQTFKGFLFKKIIFARKNPWNFLISLLLPCFAAVLILLDHGVSSGSNKSTPLTLDNYYRSTALVYTENNIFGSKYRDTVEYFKSTANIVSSNLSLTDSLLRIATNDLSTYRNKLIVSAEFNGTNDNIKANGFYSGSALLSVPITINCVTNTLIKALTNNSNYRIEASAQSLPDIDKLKQAPMLNTDVTLSMIVFLAPAIAMYVTQPLTESLSGIKQLQIMTGAPTLMYWGATFLFDIIQYIVSVLLLLVTFISIDKTLGTEYYQLEEILIFIGLLILFGISVLPFVYLTSFLKKTLNSTIIALCVAPLVLTAIELILFAFSMELKHDAFKIFRKIQSNLFLLIPHVSFIYGHLSFHNALVQNARCRRMPNKLLEVSCISGMDPCCGMDCFNGVCKKPLSYFDELHDILPSLRKSMIYLSCLPIIFFTIISLLELKLFAELLAICRRRKVDKNIVGIDEMVLKEKFIVNDEISRLVKNVENNLYQSENIFLVQELEKYYGRFHAVKGITFRVREGECFGLLGVNGAGKSTTFRMLTGDSIQSNGTMYLKDSNISTDRVKYLMQMGYCPQQDALIDTFNSWDHLNLFARLRGIPDSQIDLTVQKWISKLNLTACAIQPSGTYSGGNKRRLNIAIALIGNPPLVLMDEPTTGVDPAARRSLWNTLKACQSSGQSIILTSHSMEECEVLCNRLVIMVGGQLVCVGASQELKQRFGAGYNIHIKLSPDHNNSHIDLIKIKIESNFACKLTDENTGFIGYHITDPKVTWTAMYTVMNELKNDFNCIEDFVVLSSTLEQLFIQFARAPTETTQLSGVVTESWKIQTNESGL